MTFTELLQLSNEFRRLPDHEDWLAADPPTWDWPMSVTIQGGSA